MKELTSFAFDTEDPQKNYDLAAWYENMGHTAPAHTYFLRAAERYSNGSLAYSSLIRASFCYKNQGSRDATEKVLLENALSLDPNRPEAYYFLAKLYEKKQEWQSCYICASQGLKAREQRDSERLPEYQGEYMLIYQKAMAAWWWGRSQEARDLFKELMDDYWSVMDNTHQDSVESTLSRLGITKYSQSEVLYSSTDHSQLRYKFPGSENIQRNYSQIFQDLFVLAMLNGKTAGSFLEIGGAKPFERNNTALLSREFGWRGVSIEFNSEFAEEYTRERPETLVINEDALSLDYKDLLLNNFSGKDIDYLQLDIEPARNTYECLLRIPFDDFRFAVITYEHDFYIDPTKSYREKSREFLQGKGYALVASDLSTEGKSAFEDWWVHPDLVDDHILKVMQDISGGVKSIRDYMLCNKYYSEFDTDKYIRENFFPYHSFKGVMVEVGAGPPEFLSTSKHFRDNGWRTICLEPNPKFAQQHRDAGSEVYELACSNQEKNSVEFIINSNNDEWYTKENDGVSFSSLGIRYKEVPSHNTQETITVGVTKLDTILEQAGVEKVDVLSIDVEGWEREVLEGFDHVKYSPKVIVIENFENNPEYETFMNGRGYQKHIELGYNHIYTQHSPLRQFSVSQNIQQTSWIVDNFYENPGKVREFALQQDYLEGGIGRGFIGRRTHQQFLFPGLKEKFEEIMGMQITKWDDHGMNGRFQIAWSGEPLVYHCDSQKWGGMLYLTPNAPYQCGTTLYAHKQTRARTYYDKGWDAAWGNVPGDCHLDGTPFEPVDVLGNVYNRLVIFDASCIHSASQYFGTVTDNARLWQMFFFDT